MTNTHPYSVYDGMWTDSMKDLLSDKAKLINMCINESTVIWQSNSIGMGSLTRPGRGKGAILPHSNFY